MQSLLSLSLSKIEETSLKENSIVPDLTEAEKKALKEKNKIRKLELEFEREMNKGKAPNPFDLKAKGGRAGYKHGGAAKRGHGCEIK